MRYVLAVWLAVFARETCAVEFTPLPRLDGRSVVINALSANGGVGVGTAQHLTEPRPVIWVSGSGLEFLSGNRGGARDVSADGSVVVGNLNGKAVVWYAGDDPQFLPEFRPGDGGSDAYGVSADGSTVVGVADFITDAVRWSPGRVTPIVEGEAVAASHDGSIVAGRAPVDVPGGAFRWTEESGLLALGTLPRSGSSLVRDMTPDGRLIIGQSDPLRGFLWTNGSGMVELGFIPSGISDDGRVIVGTTRESPVISIDGVVADLGPVFRNLGLDLTGWTLTNVTAISGDGLTLAGQGIPPDPSLSGAWIATIPEPGTWLLTLAALAFLVAFRKLRR